MTDYIEVETNAKTGEVTERPLSSTEIALLNQAPPLSVQFENIRKALQAAIDEKAHSLGFSGGNALILYAGFNNPFQTLAQQFASWEVTIWVEAGQYKQQVLSGDQPMVTANEAISMMPAYPAG